MLEIVPGDPALRGGEACQHRDPEPEGETEVSRLQELLRERVATGVDIGAHPVGEGPVTTPGHRTLGISREGRSLKPLTPSPGPGRAENRIVLR